MKNNPTGAMGVRDYLGLELEVQGRHPDREHPGLPGAAGQHDRDARAPRVRARRAWRRCPSSTTRAGRSRLFGRTAHESCNRAAFYEQGDFATEYGADHRCLVKLGCKGPVVKCNVPLRGWQSHMGGCPNVGGICMACTMPGFPDKYMPFMDEDPTGERVLEPREVHLRPAPALGPQAVDQAQVRQGAGVAAQPRRAHDRLPEALVREQTMAIAETPTDQKVIVKEMSWDPVTRIVGSLGIHTEIDFTNQQVLKCYSTSMLFRGFDIFMKGIDPRDAHFITSRICGICGDNHCTCSCLNQNMAYCGQAAEARRLRVQPRRVGRLHVRPRDLQRLHGERGLQRADGQGDQPGGAREGREARRRRTPTSTATRRSPTSCAR